MSSTNTLSQNRAEEFGFDLFNQFVIPPIFEKLDFQKSAKSKFFIGGRGCGKTMLLRYLSHQTSFSKAKDRIEKSDLNNIGLYWKADTNIVFLLQKRGLDSDVWDSAFEHLLTVVLSVEFIKSLESISESSYPKIDRDLLSSIKLNDALNDFGLPSNVSIFDLKAFFKNTENRFHFWLKNVRNSPQPIFLPKLVLTSLIEYFKSNIQEIQESVFHIYIDEYENLIENQQKIINTWVKHSEIPVVFHLAMKRNAFRIRETIGNESLSDVHDYRIHDLEESFNKPKDFMVFASEILIHRLHNEEGFKCNLDLSSLKDPSKYQFRKDENYQNTVLKITEEIFPTRSHKELAHDLLISSKKRVLEKLETALRTRNLVSQFSSKDFMFPEDMRVTLVCISLLYREQIDPKIILEEAKKAIRGLDSKFTGTTDWLSNNFIGAYLLFHSSSNNKICHLYTGFKTYCLLSGGNIRHLMELCHKAILRTSEKVTDPNFSIAIHDQANAAKQASTTFLNEIKTFGRYGNQLHTFTLRLGTLFALAQTSRKQSEPEINHFSISAGNEEVNESNKILIEEAIKWSVLIEQKTTKKKSNYKSSLVEYVLNPIYSPYFQISYRKMRRLNLPSDHLNTLMNGALPDFERVLKTYGKRWILEQEDETPDLFSNLNID